jgi:hypothetical protein
MPEAPWHVGSSFIAGLYQLPKLHRYRNNGSFIDIGNKEPVDYEARDSSPYGYFAIDVQKSVPWSLRLLQFQLPESIPQFHGWYRVKKVTPTT